MLNEAKWGDFNSIGIVDGSGTSNQTQQYMFIDNNPYSGISYYRLKQTDFNGNVSYSAVRKVSMKDDDFNIVVYPNPVIDFVTVTFSKNHNAQIAITDLTGKVIKQVQSDSEQIQLDFTNLNSGSYFIVADSSNSSTRKTIKVVKQ
ncbi:MAG: T9SS type A sorting domain-containing protein [Bacteroidetes bacterium]|nr:T9SS type A sorting domain-containing protein [Bacteroidota bacterium]